MKTGAGGAPFLKKEWGGSLHEKKASCVGKGCPHRERARYVERGRNVVPWGGVRLWKRGVPHPEDGWGEWVYREGCTSYCGPLWEQGFPLWGKEGPALKGVLGGREGLAEEGRAWGEGLIHQSQQRGGSLEGNMCSGVPAIPRGRVESRAWAVRGGNKASTLHTRRGTPQPNSPRLPAKPSILRGKLRARGSAGRALHSADRQSGRRWAWPARSFGRPARLPAPASVVRPSAPGQLAAAARPTSPSGWEPRRSAACPASLPEQQPRAPRRAPPPRPRAAVAPPPRTPSRFRLRLPRDDTEAGACRPFPLTLSGPRIPPASRRTSACACAVSLLRSWDLGLEAGSEWVGLRGGLRPGIPGAWKDSLSSQPLGSPLRPSRAGVRANRGWLPRVSYKDVKEATKCREGSLLPRVLPLPQSGEGQMGASLLD